MTGDEARTDESRLEIPGPTAARRPNHPALHWMGDSGMGLCGGLVIALAADFNFEKPLSHVSVEAAIAFRFIHSLRWQKTKHNGVMSLRAITAVTWMVHAVAWTHVDGTRAGCVVPSAAVVVLAVYGIAWLVTGRWWARI